MNDLNRMGGVQTNDQIKADRLRKGFCDTCYAEPVKCYEIKKRIGGMLRERIALNIPGKVHNGTCLVCHPDQDPDQERRKKKKNASGRERDQRRDRDHRRHHDDRRYNDQRYGGEDNRRGGGGGSGQPYSADAFRGDDWVRSHSTPEIERQPGQAQSRRDLVQSLPSDVDSLDIQDEEYYEDNEPVEYEEVVEYNIFNEPVVVRKPKPRQKKRSGRRDGDGRRVGSSPPNSPKPTGRRDRRREGESPPNSPSYHSPRQQSHRHQQHEYRRATPQAPSPLNYEEKEEIQSPEDWEDYPTQQSPHSPHGQNYDHHHLLPPPPDLATPESASQCSGWEEMDELEREIARHVFKRPEQTTSFVPGTTNVMQNAFLECPDRDRMDEISVMTPDTCFVGQQSVASIGVSRRTNLTAISEGLSSGASSGRKRSLQSHQIHEPAAVQDMESYLENSAPHLMTLREIVGTCTEIGEDAQAIDVVTQALIHDNGTTMSLDLALFSLTTLWVLARKSDENKRKILLEDATFEAIIETMNIYRESSQYEDLELQTRACGVLWSLSMDPGDRKHVAQGGGCEAILNAMLVHMNEDELQVMALGALKVLSFDNIGKSFLRSRGALSIVSNVMQKHINNPTIQSEGCVILGNLAVDETTHFVAPVSAKEVDAVVQGMLAHPDSLEVQESACFTLMSLASSATNVDLIHRNTKARVALELAFKNHPDDVGGNVLNLIRRLKFDAPPPAVASGY